MKQVIFETGAAKTIEVPDPSIQSGTILVSVAHSCISPGTEEVGLQATKSNLIDKIREKPERISKAIRMVKTSGVSKLKNYVENRVLIKSKPSGYSIAGTVLSVADDVTGFRPGDRVAAAGNTCAYHASRVVIPKNLAVRIPDSVTTESAATVALGSIALQGIRRAHPAYGETYLVIGLGALGQLCSQMLQASGCTVIGSDIDDARLALAISNGLHHGLNPQDNDIADTCEKLTGGIGVDGVIITASGKTSEIVSSAFSSCRKKGKVILVGDVGLDLKRSDIYAKELDFLISCSYGPGRYDPKYELEGHDYPSAYVRWTENRNMSAYIDALSKAHVNLSSLIGNVYPVHEAPRAFEHSRSSILTLLSYPANEPEQRKITFTNVENKKSESTINIGFIGAGTFTKSTLIPNLKKLRFPIKFQAFATKTGLSARNLAKENEASYATTNYEEIIQDESIQAVFVATRHNLHAEITKKALEAGKYVFLEKPLCTTPEQLGQLRKILTSEAGSRLMVGFNRRFSPAIQQIKQYLQHRSSPLIINYQMNAGFQSNDHWIHGEEGGGRNIGEACHIYDLFLHLTGSVYKSFTYTPIATSAGPYRNDDNFVTCVSLKDGSVATLTYTSQGSENYPKEEMTIFSEGKLISMKNYSTLSVYDQSKSKSIPTKLDKGHKEELKQFMESVSNNTACPIGISEILQATEISFIENRSNG